MEEKYTRGEFWNAAGTLGLMLGVISCAYFALSNLMSQGTEKVALAMIISVVSFLLWIAKFVGCIYVMKSGMKRFASAHSEVDNSDTFRFGAAAALLSALIYSGMYLLFVTVINPDIFTEAMQLAAEQYSSIDPSITETLEQVGGKLPQISFFANLIYCSLFGTILSAILSKNIPSQNPFDQQ